MTDVTDMGGIIRHSLEMMGDEAVRLTMRGAEAERSEMGALVARLARAEIERRGNDT